MGEMKKRWISLYVENRVGVLARIAGLFSGKSYNLKSLTVGTTEDETVSRMTIAVTSDDATFEQIKKQLNRSVEVIKVMDYTAVPIRMKEVLFIKVKGCSLQEKNEIFQMADVFRFRVVDYGKDNVLIESLHTEGKNDNIINFFNDKFSGRIEVVRGGGVAIESISIVER
ncbi:MAG: acetolactate synthase small subunit [Anaerostipes sp.]|nr:acetolactate synthase small subunit [Anaerostipes sp. 992a]MCI5952726.1 acetolactate synthase small subunit [Anaerostipes sp.]MDD5969892.1 acetolactate synthase small subunit [Anaerostipes sp.]